MVRSRIPQAIRPPALAEGPLALEAFVRRAPLAVIVLDDAGVVRLWNRSAERLLGWRADETVGRANPAGGLGRRTGRRDLVADVVVARRTCWQRKDGSRLDIRLSSAPLRDTSGLNTSVIVFVEEAAPLAPQGGHRA